MKTAIIIPAYNEAEKIKEVLEKAKYYADKIIVVDDGSTQQKMINFNFGQISDNIVYLKHRINLGKGAALKTGCEAAVKLGAKIIVLMDADGQHKPEDVPRLVEKMEKQNLDIVFGYRRMGKNMPLMMMLGNKFLSFFCSFLFGTYLSDTQNGFRAFKAGVYPMLKWNSTRYSVETEMIVNTGKNKLRFGEIEMETIYHDKYKGTTIIDGIRIFLNMLIWRII